MAALDLILRLTGVGSTTEGLDAVGSKVAGVGESASGSNSRLSSFFSNAKSGAASLLTVGGLALGAFGAAFGFAAGEGLAFNNSMEIVTAQLSAFLPTSEAVEETLEMVKARAAQTPFAFEEMAQSVAALIPTSNATGQSLESLIGVAEILAASNPEQGLVGATVALKEALGGDFVSIVERFNLPRQRLNELKEQGVPAMEAVTMVMTELGLTSELVTNLANTASGRWSSISDNLVGIAAQLTAPIFDRVSAGMGTFLQMLTDNEATIQAFVDQGVARVVEGLNALELAIGAVQNGGLDLLFTVFEDGSSYIGSFAEVLGYSETEASALAVSISDLYNSISPIVEQVYSAVSSFVEWQDVLMAVGLIVASVVVPAVLSFLAPFAAVGLAIAALTGLIALLRTGWEQNWGGIQEKTAAVVGYIVPAIQAGLAFIQQYWADNGQQIMTNVQTAWNTVVGFVTTGITNAKTLISAGLAFIQQYWEDNGESIMDSVETAWEFIESLVDTYITSVSTIVSTVLTAIQTYWANHGDAIMQIATSLWGYIEASITNFTTIAEAAIDAFFAVVEGDWFSFGENLRIIAETVWTNIKNSFNLAVGILTTAMGEIVESLFSTFNAKNWGELGSNMISSISTSIRNGIGVLIEAAQAAAQAAYEAALGFLTGGGSESDSNPGAQSAQTQGSGRAALAPAAFGSPALIGAGAGRSLGAGVAPIVNFYITIPGGATSTGRGTIEEQIKRGIRQALQESGFRADTYNRI
jgi:phage-related protein